MYRNFSDELEAIAQRWGKAVYTEDEWSDEGCFGTKESKPITESKPREVHSASGFRGIAKPGEKKTDGIARAAHEKIASDLAYILRLPVPPVILWDRGDGFEGERYTCISAFAFEQAKEFNNVPKDVLDSYAEDLSIKFSAISPFEVWIGAEDRKPAHSLVGDTNSDGIQLAFIDYAYSLSKRLNGPNDDNRITNEYNPYPIKTDIVDSVSKSIQSLSDAIIDDIVERIPSEYLSDTQREVILNNLKFRRDNLPAIMR